jgi:hypothetical protein
MDAPALSYPWLYTISLQWLVTDRLDGVTPSPEFVLPPNPAANVDPDSNCVLVGTVERLGLIDLCGGVQRGQFADRLIRHLLIVGPNPAAAGADIGLAFDGIADPNGRIPIPLGAVGLDSGNCIFVPQTAQLQIQGLTASPGAPILVRLNIWQPKTIEELAEMVQACCCRAATFDEEGEPFYTTALYINCTRTVTSALPNTAARGAGPTAVVVGGTGFADGDLIFFFHEDGLGQIPVLTSAVITPNIINVAIDVDGSVPLGDYNILVAPPESPPQCQGLGEGLFSVT